MTVCADLHGDGYLMGALVRGPEEPSGGLPLFAQKANGLWHRHILEAGVKDGPAHKLLLALISIALSLYRSKFAVNAIRQHC